MLTLEAQVWQLLDRTDRLPDDLADIKTKVDSDGKYIRTPYKLCNDILSQIHESGYWWADKKILVVDTVEFIPILLAFGVNKCNITYVAPYKYKGAIAKALGASVIQDSLITWKTDMKFDVIVGNPPYNNGSNQTEKPWVRFVTKSMSMVTNDGYLSMVTPNTWYYRRDGQKIKLVVKCFLENNLIYANVVPSSHFGKIGDDIGWWVVKKNPNYHSTEFFTIDGTINESFSLEKRVGNIDDSICDKLMKSPLRKINSMYASFSDSLMGSSTNLLALGIISEHPTTINTEQVFWSSSKYNRFTKPLLKPKGWRLIFSRSGYFCKKGKEDIYLPVSDTIRVGQLAIGVKVENEQQGLNLRSILISKLYEFVISIKKTNGWNEHVRQLPVPNLDQHWNDLDLYHLFNLTQEEINHIEGLIQ